MGSCIICSTSVDGLICRSHEEDVAFTFTGDNPEELKVGRFYEGVVDGIAEFGVFVTIGGSVTGLLHRSELPTRLEGLPWNEGDQVFTQILGVHDNGNIDLGWSIRQSTGEFRAALCQTPSGDERIEAPGESTNQSRATANGGAKADNITLTTRSNQGAGEDGEERRSEGNRQERSRIESLEDRLDSRVTIEGQLVAVRQTTGPTLFKVRDETGIVTCAGFDGAGVRAFPEIDAGDVVRVFGKAERRKGDIQIEIESVDLLDDDASVMVVDRLEDVVSERAAPDNVILPTDHQPIAGLLDEIRDAATEIRRAIIDSRPIVVRHTARADGYVAGAAIERAVISLLRQEHERNDAEYQYFERQPLDDEKYDMSAATADITRMLDDRERYGEKLPLVVLVDTGTTTESIDGLGFLNVYNANRIIINAGPADDDLLDGLDIAVQTDDPSVTTTTLAVAVAGNVDQDIREDIQHLPAVSYWESSPDRYLESAAESGFDAESLSELREAVELEAYYQSYADKRELISDLLFTRESGVRGLASHVSEQFRIKLEDELSTVRPHLDQYDTGGIHITMLDLDDYTHRFDFPPKPMLIDALHRDQSSSDSRPQVTIGLGEDTAFIRSTEPISMSEIEEHVETSIPTTSIDTVVRRNGGHLTFLPGERPLVQTALIEGVGQAIDQ